MITVRPYEREAPHRGVGVLTEGGRVLCEDGKVRTAPDPRQPTQIYVTAGRADHILTSGYGTAHCWGARPYRWLSGEGLEATIMRTPVDPTDEQMLAGLIDWRDHIEFFGGRISSLGSTAFSLFKATLRRPFYTGGGRVPPINVLIGGRQHMGRPAGTYLGPVKHWDLSASYPTAMSKLWYGSGWCYLPRLEWNRIVDAVAQDWPVFARARVEMMGTTYGGPLPIRPDKIRSAWEEFEFPISYPSTGRHTGVWTGAELVAAAESGAGVVVKEGWMCWGRERPFLDFFEIVTEGRKLEGYASWLMKGTANALWGQFAMLPQLRQSLTFQGGSRRIGDLPLRSGRPPALDLAETITGSVRSRLWAELIWPAQGALVSAHTDGGWVWDDQAWSPDGEGWRCKDVAEVIDLLNPQGLAYLRPGERTPHYCLAGIPPSMAPRAFLEMWRYVSRDVPGISRGGG